jgi:hypothetical protein
MADLDVDFGIRVTHAACVARIQISNCGRGAGVMSHSTGQVTRLPFILSVSEAVLFVLSFAI